MLVCIVITCTESDYFAVLNERINRKSWQQRSKLQLLGNLTIAEFKLLKQICAQPLHDSKPNDAGSRLDIKRPAVVRRKIVLTVKKFANILLHKYYECFL